MRNRRQSKVPRGHRIVFAMMAIFTIGMASGGLFALWTGDNSMARVAFAYAGTFLVGLWLYWQTIKSLK
jgi:hypothetical protein